MDFLRSGVDETDEYPIAFLYRQGFCVWENPAIDGKDIVIVLFVNMFSAFSDMCKRAI